MTDMLHQTSATMLHLREFVDELEQAGELLRVETPVSLREVAAITEGSDQAVLVEHPAGCVTPLLANAMASRRRCAIALGVDPAEVSRELQKRIASPLPPVSVETGPVKDVCLVGDDVDLTLFPAYLQHELDGGPYISAALDITRDPETGRYNAGVRRLMLRGPRETGVDMVAPSDLRGFYRRARELGQRFELAFVVGSNPLDYIATQMRVPAADELAVMGGLRGSPVPLVRCETVDLSVPADAEIVIEGYLEGDWVNFEGPFGEYTGCYGAAHLNPIFKVTAITRRSDAIFQTATIGGKRLHHTDTAVLASLSTELAVWEAVSRAVARPVAVYCPPSATGMHHTRIALRVRDPGDGRNACVAALASNGDTKLAIAVDDDIDVFSDTMTEWAIATRFQADTDTVVLSGMRTFPLDPSLPPHEGSAVVSGKLGIDATRRFDKPPHVFNAPLPPFERSEPSVVPGDATRVDDVKGIAEKVLAQLGEGMRFVEMLRADPSLHEGDLVKALGLLRERGTITLEPDGRYIGAVGG